MQQSEYRQASTHLRRLAKRVDDFVAEGWSDTSPAAASCKVEPHAGLWRDRPQREAALTPMYLMLHATDHIRGLAAALDEPDVVMAMLSLVRPALESVATGYYLLEPGTGLVERLRRAINVHLAAEVEALRLMAADERGERSAAWLKARHTLYWLNIHAGRHGFELHRGQREIAGERDAWLGARPPSAMALAEVLFDDVDGGKHLAQTMHRLTSAVVHGQMHGLLLFLVKESAEPLGDGMSRVRMGLALQDFATWSSPVVYGLHRLLIRACDEYGWPVQRWQRVAQPALADWGRWMR